MARPAAESGRKAHKKTRTGCMTCKIRRIKCDEAKPECLRCSRTGRRCDGYLNVRDQTSSNTYRELREKPVVSELASANPKLLPSDKVDWTSTEQRAFYFYQHFSGTAVLSSVNPDFWTRVIPALCYHEPALRHAVFAIGELLETRCLKQQSSKVCGIPSQFAAIQYGKAMSCLRSWKLPSTNALSGTATTALPLLACALFICIEFMTNNAHAAQIHIEQGRRLLAQFDSGPSPTTELVKREIVPIFTRLTLALTFLGSTPHPLPAQLRWTPSPSDRPFVYRFETVLQAAQSLYEFMDDFSQFSPEITPWIHSTKALISGFSEARAHMEMQRDTFLNRLRLWRDAFKPLIKVGFAQDETALTSMVYYHMFSAFVAVMAEPLSRRESEYDRFVAHFANIVILAGHILHLETLENRPRAVFSFESGIIPPLNYTMAKCRHPHVRRSAHTIIQSLARLQQAENLWEPNEIQHFSQRIMTLEEVGNWMIVDGGASVTETPLNASGGEAPAGVPTRVPLRTLRVRPDFEFCRCTQDAMAYFISHEARPCSKQGCLSSRALSSAEVMADLLGQSLSGPGDPGLAWLSAHPAQYPADRDRIHAIRVEANGETKSTLKVYVHPDPDDPLTWGVYEEDVVVTEWAFICH